MEPQSPALFSAPRMLTPVGSILVSLSSGTNYIYSAYAPQLGARLFLSHTQLNVIGLAGNGAVIVRINSTKPLTLFSGRIHQQPTLGPSSRFKGSLHISAFTCFLIGYLGIKRIYDDGAGTTISFLQYAILTACSFVQAWLDLWLLPLL
ncbi:hypothetical protein BDR07DRAFT_685518 [Suillus spraguei]|nr:hypothetical protein BDR07DRAFT_685518 [Suillus spraguei]